MFAEVWYKTEICNSAAVLCLVAQSCSILFDPMDCSPPGTSVHGDSPGKNTSGLPCPPPGDLPNPGIEPRFPTLQVDSLPAEPPGKPNNTGVGSPSLPPGDLPNPGIKLESPALQKDSLPAELPGKALQLTSYSNLNGRSSPWYWRDSTYSFFL